MSTVTADPVRVVLTETTINGRKVDTSTVLKVRGERGLFRFAYHVLTEAGVEWITVYGGPGYKPDLPAHKQTGYSQFRSFSPDHGFTVKRS